jgi:hypothetical protein
MSRNKPFTVTGRIYIDVEIEIDAATADEAIDIARDELIDCYGLDVSGQYHNVKNGIEFDLETYDSGEDEDDTDWE